MFASFSMKNPHIELHIEVSNKYVSLAERQADIAIRLTNDPVETLIGARLTTIASTVYGGSVYLQHLRASGEAPKWLGVECCGFHYAWTHKACLDHRYSFFVDDTLLTIAALEQGLGLAYLPCFMGDSNVSLERFNDPDPQLELGLWLLYHPDLRHTRRIVAFREHMLNQIKEQFPLFEGRRPQRLDQTFKEIDDAL